MCQAEFQVQVELNGLSHHPNIPDESVEGMEEDDNREITSMG